MIYVCHTHTYSCSLYLPLSICVLLNRNRQNFNEQKIKTLLNCFFFLLLLCEMHKICYLHRMCLSQVCISLIALHSFRHWLLNFDCNFMFFLVWSKLMLSIVKRWNQQITKNRGTNTHTYIQTNKYVCAPMPYSSGKNETFYFQCN